MWAGDPTSCNRRYSFSALLLVRSLAMKHQRNKGQDEAYYRAKSSRQPCRFKGLHHSLSLSSALTCSRKRLFMMWKTLNLQ